MATGKKSFMFYCDWKETFEALPDDKAGQLIKHLVRYVNDEEPETDDILITAVFANIKATLKRDLKKWEQKSIKNSQNAKMRWDKNNANASERIKPYANHADRVTVTDSVKDKVNDKDINSKIAEFKNSLLPFVQNYKAQMLNDFFEYWTEHNEKGKKLRFEYSKNQPFNISRRLATWLKNQNKFEKEKGSAQKENSKKDAAQILSEKYGIN